MSATDTVVPLFAATVSPESPEGRVLNSTLRQALARINALTRRLRRDQVRVVQILDWHRERPLVRIAPLSAAVARALPLTQRLSECSAEGMTWHRAYLDGCEITWSDAVPATALPPLSLGECS